jgi:hypothetical protein
MTRIAATIAFILAAAAPAAAQPQPQLKSSVTFEYREATAPENIAMRERLMQRKALEELAQFLSPLQLKRTLVLATAECPSRSAENAFYAAKDATVTVCYQYVNLFARYAATPDMLPGFSREEVFVGAFLSTVLHEIGHAVFDLLDIAVFGHEEDAADQIAAFVMLQFGPDVARTTIKGAAYKWFMSAIQRPATYYDTHGTSAQRYYNYLCIAYGGQPDTFRDLAGGGLLPRSRIEDCALEYAQIRQAFNETVLPHIDKDLLRRVLARRWLRPDDGAR